MNCNQSGENEKLLILLATALIFNNFAKKKKNKQKTMAKENFLD